MSACLQKPRDRFMATLDRRPLCGRVPHFELVFFLTLEAFGRVHPSQRNFHQWDQMEEKETTCYTHGKQRSWDSSRD
jgi:uroporphyrinogen decarboxylase